MNIGKPLADARVVQLIEIIRDLEENEKRAHAPRLIAQ
jgi:hypothetical protein